MRTMVVSLLAVASAFASQDDVQLNPQHQLAVGVVQQDENATQDALARCGRRRSRAAEEEATLAACSGGGGARRSGTRRGRLEENTQLACGEKPKDQGTMELAACKDGKCPFRSYGNQTV